MFHHSKSGASEGREEAKKIAEVVVTTGEQISESPKFIPERPKSIEKLRVFTLPSARRFAGWACLERLLRGYNGLIAPRGRERKQFAPTRPQIRNKTAFLLVGLDKDAYIYSSDPPQSAARQGSPGVFAAAEASFTHSLNIKKNISTFMPLFTPYFSLDSSAFRVGNGGRLRCRMGASGIGIYVMLLSHLRDCRDCRAPLDYDMLAFDLHEDAAAVRRVVEDFGLFDIDRSSGTFTSPVLTTVRGLLSDDGAAAGVGTTRTVRQRRVRSSGETHRRAVHRLAADNALPPAEEEEPAEGENQLAERDAEPAEVKREPAEKLPTSSENEITPAEGEPQPAELDAQPADEENATGHFAPTSIAAEGEPAEVKHEAADAEGTPAEVEDQPAEEEDVPTAFTDARSPRREEIRKEQNKKPHTPIVPFPQSGKGTRASHPAAAAVGVQEGGDASAEGDEEPVVGTPHSVPSASAERDAPPCVAAPTLLGAPAQTLDPHPSPSDPHPSTDTEKGTTNVPNSQPNPLTASEKTAHPQTDTAKADTSVPNSQANPENGTTSVPNGQTDKTNSPTSTTDAQPNALTTSEKADEAGRGEEGAVEPFVPPTANEVRRFAETLHHPEFDAEWFVAYYTERHWRRHNGRPVVSWQTTARYWLDHPLRVARHLLDHRPASSPVSVGVGAASAVVVPPAGTTAAKPVGTSTHPVAGSTSFPSTGTPPVGTGGLSPRESASSPHSGTPHVGSLSLPAPTPLQQSRLSDLKGMVLHLFADAPTAAPTSATAAPDLSSAAADVPAAAADVPANASTPDWVARNSVRPARVLSPAEAAQVIAQQTLASAESEAVPHVVHDSTADAEEIIDTQASPTNAAEEDALNGHDSTTDNAEDIDTLPFSTADTEEGARNGHDSTDEDGEEARVGEISPANAAKAIDAQVLSPADAKEYVRACGDATDEDGEEARIGEISPADAAKAVDAQVLSPADAEEYVRACDDWTMDSEEKVDAQALSSADAEEKVDAQAFSTTDAAKAIDAQAFSTADAAKDIDSQAFSTTDAAKGIDTQAFSADKGRWGVRSPRGPDPPTGDVHDSTDAGNDFANAGNDFADAENHFTAQPSNFSADRHSPAADRHPPAAVGTARAADPPIFAADECRPLRTLTEKHPYLNPSFHEPHPLLRLHPPSFGGFGLTFRVQSAQPPFGRPFLGRFVDIRPACTVGSRPLRLRLTLCRTERGRCRLEHPDREHHRSADTCERSANAILPPADAIRPPEDGHEHGTDGRKRHDSAPEHTADTPEHGAQCAKIADFIDVDPARGHQTERNAIERSTNAVSPLADAGEHTADERKRHDPADGHKTDRDEPEHPAYDPDAGQRVLRSAAHRRTVRAEREACCGALRHLAHCCVAF